MADEATKTDPLQQLLVDAQEVDRSAIAGVLKGIMSIDSSTGRLVLAPGFIALDATRKILAVLLGQKAAALLKVVEAEALTNKQTIELSGLPSGTVAPTLRRLKELHLVDQDNNKAYYIPNARMHDVMNRMVKGGSE